MRDLISEVLLHFWIFQDDNTSTKHADALVPYIMKTSETLLLNIQDKGLIYMFHKEWSQGRFSTA